MQIIQETIPLTNIDIYPFHHPESVCFFDIETTGLSADVSSLYLIGAITLQDKCARLIQWFADDYESERPILKAFFDFIKSYRLLVHFNGNGFDVPYLRKKASRYDMDFPLDSMESMDIYKRFRPYKGLFSLGSIRQKALEEHIGIHRKDVYDGGQLVKLYSDFMQKKIVNGFPDADLQSILLLHNRDDIVCMLSLSVLCMYPDVFAGNLPTAQLTLSQEEDCIEFILSLPVSLPLPVTLHRPFLTLSLKESLLTLTVSCYQGELKHFFSNVKDYYYLPEEDNAIHKSLAVYVDKEFKEKAKASNCYTRRRDTFLPFCPDETFDTFRESVKSKPVFFLKSNGQFDSPEWCSMYFKHLLRTAFDGKEPPTLL